MTGSGWSNCSDVAAQTRPYYFRRCKRKMLKTTNIESLPDDIIIEILVRIPAQDIHDSTRLVCRKWYKLIKTRNFIHSHLHRSTPGLHGVSVQSFMTMQNGLIEIFKLNYGLKGTFLYSCDGLVLLQHESSKEPYVVNPVTKQHLALPSFFELTTHDGFVLAYASSLRAYKVLRVSVFNYVNIECAMVTVGVDTNWGRRVSTRHLSLTAKDLLIQFPLSTRGFVHWARDDYFECVLTMNVESEIITRIPGPCLCHDDKSLWCCYLPMGRYLSLLIDRSKYSWDVWRMKPETGEWTKMPTIDLEHREVSKHVSFNFKRIGSLKWWLKPVGWSNSEEVLFFRVCTSLAHIPFSLFVAWNVRTREMDACELDYAPTGFVDHRSSLVWLD